MRLSLSGALTALVLAGGGKHVYDIRKQANHASQCISNIPEVLPNIEFARVHAHNLLAKQGCFDTVALSQSPACEKNVNSLTEFAVFQNEIAEKCIQNPRLNSDQKQRYQRSKDIAPTLDRTFQLNGNQPIVLEPAGFGSPFRKAITVTPSKSPTPIATPTRQQAEMKVRTQDKLSTTRTPGQRYLHKKRQERRTATM